MYLIWKYFNWVLYHYFAKYLPELGLPFGKVSKKIKYFLVKQIFKECGNNVHIGRKAYFQNGFDIKIGNNSGIGVNAWISNNTIIGSNVLMGPDVIIYSGSHEFIKKNVIIKEQGYNVPNPVVIGDDVWIGSRVIIMPGIKIEDGAVIGAGSIVTKNVKKYNVVAGNPAVVIKKRI